MNDAYLDIETAFDGSVTVTGIYRPQRGIEQLVGEHNTRDKLLAALEGVERLFTYNGSRFDLPVLRTCTGVDLCTQFVHRDLMYDCWRHSLYGGLKNVELALGITRDTEGLTGYDALRLWERYRSARDAEALALLLRYNREDTENLELLAARLGIVARSRVSSGGGCGL